MSKQLNYLDLFAGAGGLSEGFIRAGFNPIAHVERDAAACFTLRTRMAYHWLRSQDQEAQYAAYLEGRMSRSELYEGVPEEPIQSVINTEIAETTLPEIFSQINRLLDGSRLDLIIGGPPCQAYSVIGRARAQNRMKGDKRNTLYLFYAEFLKRYEPTYFVFENVPGLLSAKDPKGNSYLELMLALFRRSGYDTEYKVLSANDYGVPQSRKRVILVGRKGTSSGFYPEPDMCPPKVLVKEILSDLPPIKAGEGDAGPCEVRSCESPWLYESGIRNDKLPVTLHQARYNNERDLEIYRRAVTLWDTEKVRLKYTDLPDDLKAHRNQETFVNRFKVVAGDLPFSHTVVAHIAMDGHYYIHPDIEQNRSLTPREAARLQTFPDDYYFESESGKPYRTPAFRQIGNAVPVILAQKIAETLRENW